MWYIFHAISFDCCQNGPPAPQQEVFSLWATTGAKSSAYFTSFRVKNKNSVVFLLMKVECFLE